jgi:hypothetical protein
VSIGGFTDKKNPPTPEEMLSVLGPARPNWESLVQFVTESYRAQSDLCFYGKSYGWSLRYRKSGKALISLYPRPAGFTAQIVLGEAEVQKCLRQEIGANTRQAIEQATPFAEGRWLFIKVESPQDISDIKLLLTFKLDSRQ